jgi:hypothetical protein
VENARLLDKHERIESIASSLRETGGTEEQLEEVAEMMTPPEKEAVRKIHLKLDKSYYPPWLSSSKNQATYSAYLTSFWWR